MIEVYDLKELLEKYQIDADKVIKKNNRILSSGDYQSIQKSLDFLVKELNVSPQNTEKCPSVMYLQVNALKENCNFLLNSFISFSNVETCLHVLSTNPNSLKETYNYIFDNYGPYYINRLTSILSVPVSRIRSIEKLGMSKQNTLSASIGWQNEEEISKIVKICKMNNIKITGAVLSKPIEETKNIVEVCKKNNIEISANVFRKTARELEEIISICDKMYSIL